VLPAGLSVEARDRDELVAAAVGQLDDGADFVKLYLDGPDKETAPWTAEGGRVVGWCTRGATVTANATRLSGARMCAEAGVDSIEHTFKLDADLARWMAGHGVALVTTTTMLKSCSRSPRPRRSPGSPSRRAGPRPAGTGPAQRAAGARGEVAIVGGTDFGGGSARANQLPREVECLVEAGLEPWEALAAVTWRGGDLLGAPEAGVIRGGGPVDFPLCAATR
jgi:imidazolonepropionase-like amidohydrolase